MSIKPPNQPGDIYPEVTEDLKQALGNDLVGLCVFGSAAGGRYVKGKSDINFLILVQDGAPPVTGRLISFMKKWQKAGLAVPLIMTPSYVASSQDVFPIEFMVMRAAHQPVWGQDPLQDVRVDHGYLRLQLERELKAKLTALRTGALAGLGGRPELLGLVNNALPAFTALFQAYLQLVDGGFPQVPEAVLQAMAQKGVKLEAFRAMSLVRSGQSKPAVNELIEIIEQAMVETTRLAELVDAMDHKEESEQQ